MTSYQGKKMAVAVGSCARVAARTRDAHGRAHTRVANTASTKSGRRSRSNGINNMTCMHRSRPSCISVVSCGTSRVSLTAEDHADVSTNLILFILRTPSTLASGRDPRCYLEASAIPPSRLVEALVKSVMMGQSVVRRPHLGQEDAPIVPLQRSCGGWPFAQAASRKLLHIITYSMKPSYSSR